MASRIDTWVASAALRHNRVRRSIGLLGAAATAAREKPALAIGSTTANALEEAGFRRIIQSADPSEAGIVVKITRTFKSKRTIEV